MKKIILMLSAALAFNSYALDIPHEMGTASFETTPKKVVALDWVLTETVLSLGVELEGVANISDYQQWVAEPHLNADAIDVGSRREPNLELLSNIQPDVILISKHLAAAYEPLSKIAPVLVYSVYSEEKQPLESAKRITRSLGKLFDKEQQAEQVIAQTDQRLAANGAKITSAGKADKPLLFARFINDKTLRIHSEGSLAQDTLNAMGLKNDWQEPTNLWGFTTTGTEKLAEHQKANVMIFGPLSPEERQQLTQSPLWQAMEFSRTDSVYELPAIWTFGGLLAAQRLSDHMTGQLTQPK
ncbi:iron-siderophore ABC transporter substrate-binding protein [Vibrio vulnificus]|uniref:iron-siderophore ABC transporter substrate-binding protein n=1 Tax=Vibrio vulnificus TaxID=672 RepID=UPI001A2CB9E4|nr:iron-siderophore ABC transporter substrate-binding protein [Vibrio vulnificus]EHH0708485.1 iron-siderophore ABC transporter substrate-binding protein [Vibrio vulnificus]EHH1183395.1 iron-siderophore ABC transporter substrate-binding protein [Vibrio vulnificus]EIO4060172.1 iron-siderophore ABC transporter substrate-binding protein [Vibrio vulnificus]EIU7058801.1 iron-siderophore ABC transporter substrate-binding protein [Vibrio vulnificus]ELV8599142.1 iron-siderophore ABC transporter substra